MFGEEYTPQTLVACARRILANDGVDCYAQGHVSIRADDGASFWVNPWGFSNETLPGDICRMASGTQKLEGPADKHPSPAVQFHAAIYAARPDINAIIHTHSHWVQVVSTAGRIVESYAGESSFIEGVQVVLDESDWVIDRVRENQLQVLEEESQLIADGFGDDKWIMILVNHGSIVTGRNIEEATVRAMILEHGARLDVAARAIGGQPWRPDERFAGAFNGAVGPEIWAASMRRLWKTDPDLTAALESRAPIEQSVGDVSHAPRGGRSWQGPLS